MSKIDTVGAKFAIFLRDARGAARPVGRTGRPFPPRALKKVRFSHSCLAADRNVRLAFGEKMSYNFFYYASGGEHEQSDPQNQQRRTFRLLRQRGEEGVCRWLKTHLRRGDQVLFRGAGTAPVPAKEQRLVCGGSHPGRLQIRGARGRETLPPSRGEVRRRRRHPQGGGTPRRHREDLRREKDLRQTRRQQFRPLPPHSHRSGALPLLRHHGGQPHGVRKALPHRVRQRGVFHRGPQEHERHLRQQPQGEKGAARGLRPHLHPHRGVHFL